MRTGTHGKAIPSTLTPQTHTRSRRPYDRLRGIIADAMADSGYTTMPSGHISPRICKTCGLEISGTNANRGHKNNTPRCANCKRLNARAAYALKREQS